MSNTSEIQSVIDEQIRELKITSLDISFNELADMYKNEELIIKPDYQRTFRWDINKQSRFIESLLLEMPIPPIYVIEIDDGKYELIDGLQRISSYLCFRNMLDILPNPTEEDEPIEDNNDNEEDTDYADYGMSDEISNAINGFRLEGCDIIDNLNGLTFDELPVTLKIKAKRCFVRMEVLRKGINPTLKYHMFKRLNTGGEKLSPQEIRNCSIRLIDSKFIDFINKLSREANFQQTIKYVSKNQKAKKFAEELVLRFFALKNNFQGFSHNIDFFLTEYIEKIAMGDASDTPIFDYEKEEKIFKDTFTILNDALGCKVFSVYKNKSQNLTGFNVYQFEAITYGVQTVLDKLISGNYDIELLKNRLEEAKRDEDFKKYTVGGGKNSSGVLKERCNFIVKKLGD